jgi:hypothetical protein
MDFSKAERVAYWIMRTAVEAALASSLGFFGYCGKRLFKGISTAGADAIIPHSHTTQRLESPTNDDQIATINSPELDQVGQNVDVIFRTARGMVAQLRDMRVLAEVGNDLKWFESLVDYRQFYDDRGLVV